MVDVEILVHTSAPSRGHDDARYRALAQRYLQFVPATRQRLEIENEVLQNELDEQVDSQLHEELRNSAQEAPASWESYRPDDEEDDQEIEESELFPTQSESQDYVTNSLVLDSPQLSFNSVGNNADSPAFRNLITCARDNAEESQKSTDSWPVPPSTIADSQPEHNKTIGAFSSPTRMLELYLQQIESSDLGSQESEVCRRRQSINETPVTKPTSQLERNSDVRDFGYDGASEYPHRCEFPSIIRDTPARPVASPILGNSTHSDASSPAPLSSPLASVSSMLPPQTSSKAKNQYGLPSNGPKTGVVTPLAPSSDSIGWATDSPSSRGQSSGSKSLKTVQATAQMPNRISDHVQVSPSQPSTSSGVQVPKTSALGLSSPVAPNSRTPTVRIPETPYHVPPSTHDPATGEKRSRPGVSSENDQVPASAPADVGGVLISVEVEGVQPQAKKRRVEEVSTDWIPSSIPEIAPTKNASQQLAAKPQQRSLIEGLGSELSATSNHPVSNVIMETRSPTKSQMISYLFHTTVTPAPPKTSNTSLDPKSFITPCLSSLSKKLPLSKLYHPAEQSRPLRPTERGYWLINCSPWPDSLRKKCWNFLGNFIGNGRAGWGVRCERDDDWQWIRIYCWGVVVDYVYLLLFLSSENKVRRVECTWIGGDGNALITMPKVS